MCIQSCIYSCFENDYLNLCQICYQISVEINGRLSGHHECSDVRDKRTEIDTYTVNPDLTESVSVFSGNFSK